MSHVLLLNANAQPISFLPISVITWQDAIRLVCLDTATALHVYEDWEVHSPSVTMLVPSVMILREQIHNLRRWMARDQTGPQKQLVFLRDKYVCQYCAVQFPRSQLTLDHVIPRMLGGRTRWDNVATCCARCNCTRGHNISIQPRNRPYRPSYGQLVRNLKTFPISIPQATWNWYLGWDTDKVRVIRNANFNTSFDIGMRFTLDYQD